jgi:hypothetical protein
MGRTDRVIKVKVKIQKAKLRKPSPFAKATAGQVGDYFDRSLTFVRGDAQGGD